MKKTSGQRALIAVISTICIGIVAVCWAVNRDKGSDFFPDAPVPSIQPQEWQESRLTTAEDSGGSAGSHTPAPIPTPAATPHDKENCLEGYPKVIEESAGQVTISFTPEAGKLQPEPPAPPTPEGVTNNPSTPPYYAQESISLTPEPTAPPVQGDAPAPGAVNGDGAVYDPVFGWVFPSRVNQTTMDSPGDPDKMVGSMGR